MIFLQNKVFVYRGLEYERMEAFTQRLQTEFPTAQLLTKNSPPSQTILQSDAQCMLYLLLINYKDLTFNCHFRYPDLQCKTITRYWSTFFRQTFSYDS